MFFGSRYGLAVVFLVMIVACDSLLGPAEIAGVYELDTIDGDKPPVRVFRTTIYSGRITLERNGHYFWTTDSETCVPGSECTRSTGTTEGTWLVLHDGTLYFHNIGSYSFPWPRVTADGDKIVFCPDQEASSCAPTTVYKRLGS